MYLKNGCDPKTPNQTSPNKLRASSLCHGCLHILKYCLCAVLFRKSQVDAIIGYWQEIRNHWDLHFYDISFLDLRCYHYVLSQYIPGQ